MTSSDGASAAPLAGRIYVPRLYGLRSTRNAIFDRVEKAIESSGGKLIYSSRQEFNRVVAPVYLGIESREGERLGVVCYPFTANSRATRNRPSDEHRLQVRYLGESEWDVEHHVAHDIALVDTTVVVGVHTDVDLFVGLDPIAYDPLPMGISIEFKDADVNRAQAGGWHVVERVNRPGVRREKTRTLGQSETLVFFTPDRFVDYLHFERQAFSLGLDAPLRHVLAAAAAERRGVAELHQLEDQFGLPASEILDIVSKRFRLKVALKGGVAEHHLQSTLREDPAVASCEQIDEDGQPDFRVSFRRRRPSVTVECKNVSPNRTREGIIRVEVQKTRSSRNDPAARKYRFDQFDVLAACLFSVTGIWEFRFKRTRDLTPDPDYPDRVRPMQDVDDSWFPTLSDALASP